jgi:uncharacterized protein (TIRG00374 family)
MGFAVGLGLLVWLLLQVDYESAVDMLLGANPKDLVLGCLAYLSAMFFRAYRFVRVTRSPLRQLPNMLIVVLAMSLANQILPARLGEFSYVYLARKNQSLPVGRGMVSLVMARLFDLLAIGLLFVFGVGLMLDQLPAEARVYAWIAVGLVALVISVVLILVTWRSAMCAFIRRVLASPAFDRFPIRRRLVALVNDVEEGLAFPGAWGYYFDLLLSSGMVWLSSYGMLYILLQSLGASATIGQTLIGGTFASLTSILPINSLGNFGTLEAGWTAGFMLVGMDGRLALTTGFVTHLQALAYALLFGLFAWAWVLRQGDEPSQDSSS